MTPRLTVWYNTKCPVCDAGIGWQTRKLVRAAKANIIEFRDINMEPEALTAFGAGIEAVRKRLHAVDDAGRLYVGGDCARAIWRHTPGEGWIAALLGLHGVRQVWNFAYDRVADVLYAWHRSKGHW